MYLPGNLTSPRAGPILCPGAPVSCQWDSDDATSIVRGFVIEDLGPERVIWCSPSRYIGRDNRGRVFLSLDLTADLGPTVALRWLGRHYGLTMGVAAPYWQIDTWGGRRITWEIGTSEHPVCVHFTDDARFVDVAPERVVLVPGISVITDPLEAIAAVCVHAGGGAS